MNEISSIGKILTGNWRGKIGDDIVDEYWSIPLANSMMCTFRWIKDNKVSFYEFVVIDNNDEKTTMKIKHFNDDLTGWEEKTDFIHYVLLEVTDSKVIFGSEDPNEKGRLIYEKPSDDKLVATLEMAKSDQILTFEFNKL
ncbi:MAG: DUF6265 family protein [Candidatus Hodarchaeales archaeon]